MKALAAVVIVAFVAIAAENFILFGWTVAEMQKRQP